MGGTRKAVHPAMRHIPVTFPAFSIGPEMMKIPGDQQQPVIGHQISVAPQAIFMHHLFAGFLDKYHLGFIPQGKDRGMPEPVLRLEIKLVDRIVMGYMTIIAVCILPVRTVEPGGILGGHNMAVHAGLRFVREV